MCVQKWLKELQLLTLADIGDTLPTYYDAIIYIFYKASRPGTQHMNNVIYEYVLALTDV